MYTMCRFNTGGCPVKQVLFGAVMLAFASSAFAGGEIKGKITAINAANGTLEISGVTVNAKNAAVKSKTDAPCSLTDLKAGDSVEVDGAFTGPGEVAASEIEQEWSARDQVKGVVAAVDPKSRTLTIHGIMVKVAEGARLEGRDDIPITFAQLTVGARVECEGAWTGKRELSASKAELD